MEHSHEPRGVSMVERGRDARVDPAPPVRQDGSGRRGTASDTPLQTVRERVENLVRERTVVTLGAAFIAGIFLARLLRR